jgi:hypothetical protein
MPRPKNGYTNAAGKYERWFATCRGTRAWTCCRPTCAMPTCFEITPGRDSCRSDTCRASARRLILVPFLPHHGLFGSGGHRPGSTQDMRHWRGSPLRERNIRRKSSAQDRFPSGTRRGIGAHHALSRGTIRRGGYGILHSSRSINSMVKTDPTGHGGADGQYRRHERTIRPRSAIIEHACRQWPPSGADFDLIIVTMA